MGCGRSYYYEMADAFAALSYQGVYLLDIDTNKFLYTSDSPILRCGLTEEEMDAIDASYLLNFVPAEEAVQLEEVSKTIVHVYTQMPIEKRMKLSVYLNFHMIYNGRTMMVCHKLRMLDFDCAGVPHLMLGLVSYSLHRDETLFFMGISDEDYVSVFNHDIKDWEPVKRVQLSDDERVMLRLTMQGYNLEEIGKIMFKSTESIKFYRRQANIKMNVKNISEAVAYATLHRLI